MVEVSVPTVDELTAKQTRLGGDVDEAQSALAVAKSTFADAAKADPTAVEALLELATAVKAAEATVSTTQRAVKGNETAIAGIQYDASMASVLEASLSAQPDAQAMGEAYFSDNEAMCEEYGIDTLTTVSKKEPSGAITTSIKPSGEAMPKRPSSVRGGGGGERGPRSTRGVTFGAHGEATDGTAVSCREYVKACGDQASPAAQADLQGTWDGSPVSYTNEAKRLAAKNNDTFA